MSTARTYVRLSRFPSPLVTPALAEGDARVADYHLLQDGSDLTVLTTGTLVSKVVEATAN